MGESIPIVSILAQRKRLVILDEPFVGLDPAVTAEIVKLIRSVAASRSLAMILVSHVEDSAVQLGPTRELHLERARGEDSGAAARPTQLSRLPFIPRAARRLADYLLYSLPLVVCAFGATGAAVSMLLGDMLRRVDVVAIVSGFLEKYLQGNPALPMVLSLVDRIVRANEAEAKRKLYALALGSIFTIELGPLLTALLLAGRIGGSYAGEVAMMVATNQLDLLAVLGVPATLWTFAPALLAALVAAPVLTAVGTAVALGVGAVVGGPAGFDLMPPGEYWREVQEVVLTHRPGAHVLKWAPLVNVYRSVSFMAATMLIAQACARWQRRAQPRHVPFIITSAVVLSCLAVLFLDWAFSQAYVRLDDTHLIAAADPAAMYRDPSSAAEYIADAADALPEADRAEYRDEYDDADTQNVAVDGFGGFSELRPASDSLDLEDGGGGDDGGGEDVDGMDDEI